ncbi:hypothetical protein C2845_PM05G17080 [Panicum miliaceum]|uniref:Uncharacterized protein n=1 Tax=Panicum miliaceum TaxID=4540 RepID=A0A3L6SX57_PANMI|nr:hypothetical protein C2845_PM05G17080 [Panicum miliaceum]
MDAEGWGLWPEQQNGPVAVVANNLVNIPVLPQPGEPFIELNDILPAHELDLDLNAPLADDLGGIEDLVQAANDVPAQPNFGPHPEDIIDEGAPSDDDLAAVNVPLLEQENVNHLEDLMDINDQPENEQPVEHLQLGFVELVEPVADPVFSSMYPLKSPLQRKLNAEAIRIWAKHLQAGSDADSIQVPPQWSDFMTTMLVSPTSFEWAKALMTSPTWNFFMSDNSSYINFNIPKSCPVLPSTACIRQMPESVVNIPDPTEQEALVDSPPSRMDKGKVTQDMPSPETPLEQLQHKISASSGPWSKSFLDQAEHIKQASVLEDPLKRRSQRMKHMKKGFKDPQCSSQSCLGCTVVPPNLSPSVIRNLGASFCKIDEKDLTVPALRKRKKLSVAAPGGKKVPKKKSTVMSMMQQIQAKTKRSP